MIHFKGSSENLRVTQNFEGSANVAKSLTYEEDRPVPAIRLELVWGPKLPAEVGHYKVVAEFSQREAQNLIVELAGMLHMSIVDVQKLRDQQP